MNAYTRNFMAFWSAEDESALRHLYRQRGFVVVASASLAEIMREAPPKAVFLAWGVRA